MVPPPVDRGMHRTGYSVITIAENEVAATNRCGHLPDLRIGDGSEAAADGSPDARTGVRPVSGAYDLEGASGLDRANRGCRFFPRRSPTLYS
jgi:hypothetical protein